MRVAILGSGPAGLLAALACEQRGIDPIIFSHGEKSEMFGAMYLHEPIPGLTGDILAPDLHIDVIKSGTRAGYAENVYGNPNAPCSWDVIPEGDTPAWDLRAAYDKLWDRYLPAIVRTDIGRSSIPDLISTHDLVLSSIPAQPLCWSGDHRFDKQDIWVIHGPANAIIARPRANMMYYNGTTPRHGGYNWYRFSQINSYHAWEYSTPQTLDAWQEEAGRSLAVGFKPLGTNCNCWLGSSFKRIGRFGKWEKGVLTHHAYRDAIAAIEGVMYRAVL